MVSGNHEGFVIRGGSDSAQGERPHLGRIHASAHVQAHLQDRLGGWLRKYVGYGSGRSGELGIEGEALFEVGEGEVAAAED